MHQVCRSGNKYFFFSFLEELNLSSLYLLEIIVELFIL